MIKCVFFDMDGVLVNTELVHYIVWKQVFAEFGQEVEFDVYKGCIGSNNETLFRLVYEAYGVDFRDRPETLERFKQVKAQYVREKGLPWIAGVAETVRALKEKGYRMAVVSSSPMEFIEYVVKDMKLEDCFERLFSGQFIAHPKPAPDIYLEAAEAFGVRPQECVVVEDSENGSRAAKAAGMYCYGFYNPDSGIQDLSKADKIFDNFADFMEISGL